MQEALKITHGMIKAQDSTGKQATLQHHMPHADN
jgi:hypothetical protein